MKRITILIFTFLFSFIAFICLFRLSQNVNPNFNLNIILGFLEDYPGFSKTIDEFTNLQTAFLSINDIPLIDISGGIFSDLINGVNYIIDLIGWWFETLFSIIKVLVGVVLDLIDMFIWVVSFPSYLLK